MNNKEFFQNAKFGLMIHFGLYALLGGEYRGKRLSGSIIGEWIQNKMRIPNAEYEKLASVFNPIYFDADEWVKCAQDAGMTYMVVTAKHHDGFALFNSSWDNYNCVTGSPFGRDIIGELANSCAKHNMKLGLYYSQEQDWHEPNGGGSPTWTNSWDYPDESKKDFTECFEGKIKTQMKELLTNYGDLFLIWCDNPVKITSEQSMELYNMIKHYQPDCLVNSRIGNGVGDYRSCGDNVIAFDKSNDKKAPEVVTARSREREVGARTGLYECPATMGHSWGYVSYDTWKSVETIREAKERLNANGINYLLNIGPDALGRFPVPATEILKNL